MDDMSKKRTLSGTSDVTTRERKSARLDTEYTGADREADQAVGEVFGPPRELDPNMKQKFLSHVLACIVESSPHLNQRYAHPHHAGELLKDQKLLKELEEAWQAARFASIRSWGQYRH